jgi:pimeloyl-ACP methyl ester carboxylesterase
MSAVPRQFEITVPGARLRGDVWVPDAAPRGAAIVVCHGFKGFKDWGFFPYLSGQLGERTGLPVVCFNFDGSGVRDSVDEFDDLAAFSRNTFTKELFDLEVILDGLGAGRLGDLSVAPCDRFGLLGHSRGGATCILKAASRTQVQALVTWASIASVDRYGGYAERWDAGETVSIRNARTGQDMPLERNVLDDVRANGTRLDVLAAATALRVPFGVVHGDADESVPFADAEALAAAAGPVATLFRIGGAGHGMGEGHPFGGSNEQFESAIEASVAVFRRGLEDGW